MFNKTLLWDITSECNLRCKHCYNYDKYFADTKNKYKSLNIEDCESVIDTLRKWDFDHIHLLGGEPLLKEGIYDLVKYATESGINVTINTNGTLLNRENSIKLIKSGISQISVSLDSPIEDSNDCIRGKGTFKIVKENLKELSSLVQEYNDDIIVQVVSVINKSNFDEIREFPKLLKSIGVAYLNILSLYDCGNAKNNRDELMYGFDVELNSIKNLLESSEKDYPELNIQLDVKPITAKYINYIMHKNRIKINEFKCLAGDRIWLMEPNGDIYPCSACNLQTSEHLKENGLISNEIINILNTKDLNAVYNSKLYKDFYKLKKSTSTIKSKCMECEFTNICDKGCPLQNKSYVDCCDFVIDKQHEYYSKIESKKYKISKYALYKHKDGNFTFVNTKTNTLNKYNNWKMDVINSIILENNINVLEMENRINKSEITSFLLDLLSLGYIDEVYS